MVKRWIKVILLFGCCVYGIFSHQCEVDSDCVHGKVCRMICKKTCSAICVTINNLKIKNSKELKSSSEEPFAVDTNPFDTLQRDEVVTPLTISEAELEAELKQGLPTDLPPLPPLSLVSSTTTFPTPPSPISELPLATTLSMEANSPAQKPLPPSIRQHESGYLPKIDNSNQIGTEAPNIATTTSSPLELTQPPIKNGGGYDNEVAGVDLTQTEKVNEANSLFINEATSFTESFSTTSFATLMPEASSTEGSATEIFNVTLNPFETNDIDQMETDLPNAVQGIPIEAPSNGCPPPQICEKNCGVFIDENACQTCQCLWLPIPCEDSADCVEEGQFCDLGRCECMPGYIQDMLQSGICKALTDQTDLQNIAAEVHSNSSSASNSPNNYPHRRRLRRSQTSEKPHRMERLQWPGPCDRDSQCPASLYCIQGDCWHLPEKPLREISHQNDEIPKSFPLETDDDESSTTTPLPDNLPLFNFKAFPQPPPAKTSPSTRQNNEYEDAKPPSLRPLDYDESSFLGEFGDAFDVSSTTTEKPMITRMIAIEPFFSKKPKKSQRPKVKIERKLDGRPHLEEILQATTNTNFNLPKIANNDMTHLPPPKHRNPHVASEGWQPMHPHKAMDEFRIPTTTPMDEMAKVFLDYSNRKRHPVRIEMTGAKHVMRDECLSDRQCGEKFICCEKRWCDLSRDCGRANFCLPNCHTTKMTYLSSTGIRGMPLIDLVYD